MFCIQCSNSYFAQNIWINKPTRVLTISWSIILWLCNISTKYNLKTKLPFVVSVFLFTIPKRERVAFTHVSSAWMFIVHCLLFILINRIRIKSFHWNLIPYESNGHVGAISCSILTWNWMIAGILDANSSSCWWVRTSSNKYRSASKKTSAYRCPN